MAAKTTTTPGAAKPPAKPAAKSAPAKQPAAHPGKGARAGATPTAVKTESKSATPAKAVASPVVTLKHLAARLGERHDLPRKQAETMLAELFSNVVAFRAAKELKDAI